MLERDRPSVLSAYILALVATAAAVLIRWSLDPWLGPNLSLVTLFAAVATAVWYGGIGPAVLAAVAGYVVCDVLFIDPPGPGPADAGQLIGLLAFFASSSVIVGFGEALRRARRDADARGDELRTTLASIGDAVIATDGEGRIRSMNRVAEVLTGWIESEVAGRPLADVFRILNEETREPVSNPAERAIRDRVISGLANHTILVARDGTERPIDDSAAPIVGSDGQVAGCVLVFRDISERRRTRRLLERREKDLSDFFDNASVGLHWIGPDGTILRANQAELDMLGYERHEYEGRNVAEFHVDEAVISEILTRLGRGETLRQWPARLRCKDGTIREVIINSNARWSEDGRFVHSRCFTLDVTDRRRAEEARTLLASIVSASDDAIVSKTLDGTILTWNEGAERLFGYSSEEAVGRSINLIIPPELREEERTILARLARGERLDHFETVRLTRDGRRLDISLTVSPLRDERGRIIGASKVGRDITEMKKARRRVRESEARYRALVESQSEMVCRYRRDGTLLFVNGSYARAMGRTPEALEGASFWDFVSDVDRPGVEAMLDAMTPDAPEVRIENRLATADGERWTLWTNRGLRFDEEGRLLEAQSVGIDITDRRRAEQALRVSEERFRHMADAAPALIWVNDAERSRTWVNEPWLAFVGRSMKEELGDGWREHIHPEDRDRWRAAYESAFDGQRTFRLEYRLRRHDGEYRWMLDHGTPLFGDEGAFAGHVGSAIDITELKQAEEELRDADRRKDQFLATLAHELRNPLAPIGYSLELLRLAEDDRDLARKARETIKRQLDHLVRLVGDLVDISRISRGKLELHRVPVDLRRVLEHAVETCRPVCSGERVIEVSLPADPVELQADPVRLAQVFANLLNNACNYSPPGAAIRLVLEPGDGAVTVSVRDEGIGIPADQLERIFEPFAQIDRTLERATGGLGIGLTLVRQLVDLHGGSVRARSGGSGLGSEFVVRLPIEAPGRAPASASPEAPESPTVSRRILVVDDNADSADKLASVLAMKGHETRVEYDGLGALQAAEEFRPEVILLDIGLPGLNGFDVCRRIRERPWSRGVWVVALTGWGQDNDRSRSREAGFDDHLVKPVEFDSLLRVVTAGS